MHEVYSQPDAANTTCQFCGKQTPSEFNFCVECDNQIKCLECGRKTYPGKNYCLACSKPLVTRITTNQAPNQYERDVERDGDKYKEHVRFALSDKAVHEIAPFIVGQIMPDASDSAAPLPPALPNSQAIDTSFEDVTNKDGAHENNSKETENNSNESQKTEEQGSERDILSQFFQRDGEVLVAKDNDFKGQNWAEQQRNFILLFTKAYNVFFDKAVPDKEVIKECAAKLNLNDPSNFTTYLKKSIVGYMTQVSTGLILNTSGEKEVKRIVSLMTNSSMAAGFVYWNRPVGNSSPSSTLTKEDKAKVLSWENDPVDLGNLEIRDVKNARDYALLAFWIVTHHLKKANSIKWNEALLYLTTKYDTTSVTGNAFRKAIISKEGEKLFIKSGEGAYYLSTDGQKVVEDWVSGKVLIKSKTP